jgi:hypothetical protein
MRPPHRSRVLTRFDHHVGQAPARCCILTIFQSRFASGGSLTYANDRGMSSVDVTNSEKRGPEDLEYSLYVRSFDLRRCKGIVQGRPSLFLTIAQCDVQQLGGNLSLPV